MKLANKVEANAKIDKYIVHLEGQAEDLRKAAVEARKKLNFDADNPDKAEEVARTTAELLNKEYEALLTRIESAKTVVANHKKHGVVAGISAEQAAKLPKLDEIITKTTKELDEFKATNKATLDADRKLAKKYEKAEATRRKQLHMRRERAGKRS